MHQVLEKEDVREVSASGSPVQVEVTVLIDNARKVQFQEVKAADFVVEPESIRLFGSNGVPREFVVTFTLAPRVRDAGYRFANPALKFFQSSRKAGFRVAPEMPEQISATVSLFNLMGPDDHGASDDFSLLLIDPKQKSFAHDPAIAWDPPGGGG